MQSSTRPRVLQQNPWMAAGTLPTGAPSPLDFGDLALDATGAPVDDPTAAVEPAR